MKISIVTATFNSASTIRDTINSVLSQQYNNFEHVIVDGGSQDSTLDIIKDYEYLYRGRLKLICEPDKGIYDAMNKGIRNSTGDVIGVLNSDDFFSDNTILSRIAIEIENVDIVFGNLDFVKWDKTDEIVRQWKGSPYYPGAFKKGWHPAHPTFYARRKCYEKYGNFDTSLDVSADFELMLRFIEKNNASNTFIPYTFVKMRIGGESTGSLSKIINGNINVLKAFRKNGYPIPRFYLFRRLLPKVLNVIRQKYISNLT